MGTNYYRVPTEQEMETRIQQLQARFKKMSRTPASIEAGFRSIANPEDEWCKLTPWDEFIEGTSVHLGKRSGGWKFCWNFHHNRYYSDRDTLLAFIRAGRVVDEYGTEMNVEEFITMALEWGQPDGQVADKEYFDTTEHHAWMSNPESYYDQEIDGLRVSSSTEFS